MNSLAMNRFQLRDDQFALQKLKQALHIGKQVLSKYALLQIRRQQAMKLLAVTYNNLACVYRRKKSFYAALHLLQKGLYLQQQSGASKQSQAQTLLNLGVIAQQLNKEQSLKYFQKAMQLTQDIDSRTINNLKAMANYNIGCSYFKRRDLARALKHAKTGQGKLFRNLQSQTIKLQQKQKQKDQLRKQKFRYLKNYMNSNYISRRSSYLKRQSKSRPISRGKSQCKKRPSTKENPKFKTIFLASNSNRIQFRQRSVF